MKSIKKVPLSLLKEVLLKQQLDILTGIEKDDKEDRSADKRELKKDFAKVKSVDDLVGVMGDLGYQDWEVYGMIFKILVDSKK